YFLKNLFCPHIKNRLQFIIFYREIGLNDRRSLYSHMPQTVVKTKTDKWMYWLVIALIAIGIILRLYVYFQNRNLIIDEANVARNIAERGFAALALPLDYAQYAPPVFLWITKFFTMLFGMGEMALRLYPLLCGIAS